MRIAGRKKLTDFANIHADARSSIKAWVLEVEKANWKKTQDIKDRYASASFLSDNRVVFNIRGNNYRLLIRIAFETGVVVILNVGTHDEYDSWNL